MPPDHGKTVEDRVEPNIGLVPNPADGEAETSEPSADARAEEAATDPQDAAPVGSPKLDVLNVIRGFCMGAANIVPGVSGGTVALILGHYQRLIDAVSRVDSHLASLVIGRRWKSAWNYVDGRFLFGIGVGVGIGSVALAGLMNWLFDYHMSETFAVFFGMILASVLIVRRQVDKWTPLCFASCAAGALAAMIIGRLTPTDGGDSLVYLFFSAAIAICAMILPGISGAFILLLLGVYHPITGLIKNMAKLNIDLTSLMQFSVFAFGCLFGLLAFSRTLSWLLDHQRNLTMAALVGLMIGSLEKLWPLQMPTPETADLKMKERVMQHVSPSDFDGSLMLVITLAIVSAAFVLILERVAGSEEPSKPALAKE